MHCADLEASFVGTAAISGKQHRQMARRMNWLHPVKSALRKLYNPSNLALGKFSTFNRSLFLNSLTMATINMNAVQFYNPSSTAPSLSARCAATLQKHCQSTGIPHRKEWSCVLESYSQAQNTGKDIAGKQDDHASDSSIAAEEDDEFLLVDEVIRCTLHLEDSIEKPTNSALAA